MFTDFLKERVLFSLKILSETTSHTFPFVIHPLSSHLLLSSHTHAVHTPKQTQCRIKQRDLTFLLGRLKQEQLPPLPSPPSHFLSPLPLSLGFAGKQHVVASKSRAWEDQLFTLHSRTIRAEEIQESHNILHIHHDWDQAMLTTRRKTPLLSTHPMPTMFCSRAWGHQHKCLQIGTLAKQTSQRT